MCGICGMAFRDPREIPQTETLRAMAETIRHRGPDDEGIEVHGPVGLAHRRLSILDLSPAGRQPMTNEDGTVWIVFNGEIYNFPELRDELSARHQFRSHTDTEVLLHLYEELGPRMFDRLDGMFALAILDTRAQTLLLARDPFGIKPLYYAFDARRLVFGSEIKPLLASGEVARELDHAAINDYFDFLWIPAPRSIYKTIRKLPPATVWQLDLRTWQATETRYWRPRYQPQEGLSLDQWADRAEETLDRSVRAQLISDVPLGAFLSGGIDSSLVTRAAALERQRQHAAALQTFTIDFEESRFSERTYAEQVATQLGTAAQYRTTRFAALDALPRLAEFYDEPFADSSLLPTFAVSQVTREYVTVALSGDGGDELFSGYHHHRLADRLSRWDRIPQAASRWLFGAAAALAPSGTRVQDWSSRFALAPAARRFSLLRLPGRKSRAALLNPAIREPRAARFWCFEQCQDDARGLPPVTQAQIYDLLFYLPNDMLVKVDRASMAHSLEVRVPFLSRSVAELALSIPEEIRFAADCEKRVLRRITERHFGAELAYRQKRGFGIPLTAWMRAAATPEREAELLAGGPVSGGILDPGGLRGLFAAIRRGGGRWYADRSEELFAVLCFDAWWRRYQA